MKTTRYEKVADRILSLIQNGVLKEGDKIPSLRQLSLEMNVSVNTVKEAYWKLENNNYIVAIPQSGFYVLKQPGPNPSTHLSDPMLLNPEEVSLCQVYAGFQQQGICTPEISLGIAALNPVFWPTAKMGRYFQEAIRDMETESFNYIMTPGYLPLREQIARLCIARELNATPEEIIITNGCHEAIFLSLMALCQPGDTVVFESPIYFNLLQLLEQLNLKLIEIPSHHDEGMSLDTLNFVLENHDVKAVFSISNFNNPIGFRMPSHKKRQMVELLAEHDVPLIEDDIYGDISFKDRPDHCKKYDTTQNNLLCSSFSKTLAPGLRVGWVIAGRYHQKILKLKTLLNISTASMNQVATAKFLKEGGDERHLRKLRKILAEQVAAMRICILKYFPKGTYVTRPQGGFLLWVELPKPIDTLAVYQEALKKHIMLSPGNLFTIKNKYSHCLRLNAGFWNPRIEKAIQYVGQICRDFKAF